MKPLENSPKQFSGPDLTPQTDALLTKGMEALASLLIQKPDLNERDIQNAAKMIDTMVTTGAYKLYVLFNPDRSQCVVLQMRESSDMPINDTLGIHFDASESKNMNTLIRAVHSVLKSSAQQPEIDPDIVVLQQRKGRFSGSHGLAIATLGGSSSSPDAHFAV